VIGVYVQCLVEYHGWVMLVLVLMLMVDEVQHWFACAQQDSFLCMTTLFTHSGIHVFTESCGLSDVWEFDMEVRVKLTRAQQHKDRLYDRRQRTPAGSRFGTDSNWR